MRTVRIIPLPGREVRANAYLRWHNQPPRPAHPSLALWVALPRRRGDALSRLPAAGFSVDSAWEVRAVCPSGMAWGDSITGAVSVKGGRQAIGVADASAPLMLAVFVIAPKRAMPEGQTAHRAPDAQAQACGPTPRTGHAVRNPPLDRSAHQ